MAQWKQIGTITFDPWPHSAGQGSGIAVSCGVGHRRGSDLAWLWLWCRHAGTAPIRCLVWEPQSSHRGSQQVTSPASIYEDMGLIPGLVQWVEDPTLP